MFNILPRSLAGRWRTMPVEGAMRIEPDSYGLPNAVARTCEYARPTKDAVRTWLRHVIASGAPPPDIPAIRDALWKSGT